MKLFEGIDLIKLFNNDSDYGKTYKFDEITDERIKRAEDFMRYKLPESYIELLKVQNGGVIDDRYSESWLTAIYGIGPDRDSFNGLEEMFENWKDEWEYPDIGIPFGETQSGGHDMYYMDFRSIDAFGEPRIVRIESDSNSVYFVADNLVEFIKMICTKQNTEGKLIE